MQGFRQLARQCCIQYIAPRIYENIQKHDKIDTLFQNLKSILNISVKSQHYCTVGARYGTALLKMVWTFPESSFPS